MLYENRLQNQCHKWVLKEQCALEGWPAMYIYNCHNISECILYVNTWSVQLLYEKNIYRCFSQEGKRELSPRFLGEKDPRSEKATKTHTLTPILTDEDIYYWINHNRCEMITRVIISVCKDNVTQYQNVNKHDKNRVYSFKSRSNNNYDEAKYFFAIDLYC